MSSKQLSLCGFFAKIDNPSLNPPPPGNVTFKRHIPMYPLFGSPIPGLNSVIFASKLPELVVNLVGQPERGDDLSNHHKMSFSSKHARASVQEA